MEAENCLTYSSNIPCRWLNWLPASQEDDGDEEVAVGSEVDGVGWLLEVDGVGCLLVAVELVELKVVIIKVPSSLRKICGFTPYFAPISMQALQMEKRTIFILDKRSWRSSNSSKMPSQKWQSWECARPRTCWNLSWTSTWQLHKTRQMELKPMKTGDGMS